MGYWGSTLGRPHAQQMPVIFSGKYTITDPLIQNYFLKNKSG